MAKTYTLTASRYTGTRGRTLDPNVTTYSGYSTGGGTGKCGKDYDWYATSFIFDSSTLSTLRSKPIASVNVNIVISSTESIRYYLDDKANSSTTDWTITSGESSFDAGNSYVTINKGTSIPTYGYVVGTPSRGVAENSYIIISSITLTVVTSETDYSYTLSYNANGGSGAPYAQTGSNTATSPSYTFTVSNTAPTRTGYTFLGWSTSSSATAASYYGGSSITVTSSGTTTLYAVWQINTYTVSYNKGSYGTGTNTTDTKTYNVNLTLKGAIFTRAGYEQVGWSTSDGGAQAYAVGGTYTANASVTLYPVWRATTSTITTTNGTLGTSQTITITRYNSSYTHTLSYAYGAATGTIATGVGTSYNWTPPVSLASQFPSSTSGTCVITCETFSGATSLGTTATSISLAIPSTVKCTVSSVTLTETVAGINAKFGSFVQGKSKARVDIVPSTSNAYGATVTAYRTQINGQTLNTDLAVTGLLNTSGSNSYTATITDTRGRTDSYNGTFTVLEYNAPSISMTAQRNLSDLTAIDVNYSWNVSAVGNNNDKTVVIKYRVYGSSATPTVATTITPGTYSGNGSYQITGLDADTAYDIWVELTDYFTTVSSTGSVSGNSNRVFHVSATDGTVASHMANPADGWDHNANKMRFHDDVQADGDLAVGGDVSITGSLTGGGVVKTVNNVSPDASGNVTVSGGSVNSVNNISPDANGNVTLTAANVGALPDSYQPPVTSVNNKTGTVVLDNDDVNAERCLKVTSLPTAAGWYRAASFEVTNDVQNGVWGFIFDITITRAFGYASNDVHSIRLLGAYNNIQFVNEVSKSNVLGITAIRYTTSSTKAYIDIYCGANGTGGAVTVDIVPHTNPAFIKLFKAESLQSVADAPSGETITASYNFHRDISSTTIDISSSITLNGFTELQKKATLHDGVVDIFIETNFTSYQADYEYTIGAVAAAYAPRSNVFFTAQLTDANFNPRGLALFTIYTNGNMTVRVNNTLGNYPILHATYSIF